MHLQKPLFTVPHFNVTERIDAAAKIRTTRLALILLGCVLACNLQMDVVAQRPAHAQLVADGDLTDVFFVDEQNGYACGDHGLILRTHDGGKHWQAVETGVDCRLESIYFTTEHIGFAVGGFCLPHQQQSIGVLLKTVNGGKTWVKDRSAHLPSLRQVRFFDERSGWVAGDSSIFFPSGFAFTKDGGQTWSALNTDKISNWKNATLASNGFLAIDYFGGLSRVSVKGGRSEVVLDRSKQRINAVEMTNGPVAWAVGDAGVIARSLDEGKRWQVSDSEIDGQLKTFDFSTLFTVGKNCWIAGNPGSQIIHSADQGKTWMSFPTGQTTPIHKLFFISPTHGWAVGALGLAMRTQDGGRTWQVTRGGGRQTTILAFFHDPQTIPLELFSLTSAAEGRYSVVELVSNPSDKSQNEMEGNVHRIRQALGGVGCSSVNNFRLSDKKEVLKQRLVRLIRTWRPAVVMGEQTDHDANSEQAKFAAVLSEAIKEAGQATKDKTLRPWNVQKVIQIGVESDWSGSVVNSGQYAPQLGRTAEDHAFLSRQLLDRNLRFAPEKYYVMTSHADLANRYSSQGILSGVEATIGINARPPAIPAGASMSGLRLLTQKKQRLDTLARSNTNDPSLHSRWPHEIQQLIAGLPHESAGNVVFQLASRCQAAGQMELAEETYRIMLRMYPEHKLAGSALKWLLQMHASGEIKHGESQLALRNAAQAKELAEKSLAAQRAAESPPLNQATEENSPPATEPNSEAASQTKFPVQTADWKQPAINDPRVQHANADAGNVEQVGYSAPVKQAVDHFALSKKIADAMSQYHPHLFYSAEIQLPCAKLSRIKVAGFEHSQMLQNLKSIVDFRTELSDAAATEVMLARESGIKLPLSICTSFAVPTRPKLDGKLDEFFWKTLLASPLVTKPDPNTTLLIAHDQQFIYIAGTCRKTPTVEYAEDTRLRHHDPNLSEYDRVSIKLDIDRDYATFYELTIDQRGWVADARVGDPSWNPKWYVASKLHETCWSFEAAIPIEELATEIPSPDSPWVIQVQRKSPAGLVRANPQSPDRFQLLKFETHAKNANAVK